MATKKSASKTAKKKMTTELPPQAHEVRVYDAQHLLGFKSAASVRKLLELGGISARKIGRDLWFDTRSIEEYLESKRGVGRPREEAPTRKRITKEEQVRMKMREYQRDRRARIAQEGSKKSGGRAASKKATASKKAAAGKSGKSAAKSKGR
jgi:hypothetical protein